MKEPFLRSGACGRYLPCAFQGWLALLALALIPHFSYAIVDLDTDTLDDVWEERFNAQSALPGDDDDADGKTNLEECLAGTDPFDAGDCLEIRETAIGPSPGALITSVAVTFPAKRGKKYKLFMAGDLNAWAPLGPEIYGADGDLAFEVSTTGPAAGAGFITQEIFVGISGSGVSDLTNDSKYPLLPDGVRSLSAIETPPNVDNDYGGRIRGFLKPPVTGAYTLAIASRDDGELWISTDENPDNASRIAFAGGPGEPSGAIQPREWDRYANQSAAVNLVAGQKYYIEVIHKHADQEDHCSVAWDVPSGAFPAGFNLIEGEYLCPWDEPEGGGIKNELWFNLPGDDVASLTGSPSYPATPDLARTLEDLQITENTSDDYGGRICGYISAPVGGDYILYLNSRHHSEFWLSTDANPANKVLRASVTTDTRVPGQWGGGFVVNLQPLNQYPFKKYYFEVIHKHGTGDDFCEVGWKIPSPAYPGIQLITSQYLLPLNPAATGGELPIDSRKFFRVSVEDVDQDGDGLTDWAEEEMSGEGNFSPFDANSTASGLDDLTTVSNALGAGSETVELIALDLDATEDARSGAQVDAGAPISAGARDVARLEVVRTGGLQPLTVSYTLGAVALPDESAESADYTVEDMNGTSLSGTVTLGFGHVSNQIVFVPVDDSASGTGNEYPEKVTCTLVDTAAYDLGATDTALVTIFDCLEIPEQETLFVGSFSEDDNAVVATVGNGFVSGRVNGRRNKMRIWNQFNNLTSPQEDSHVHKAGAGNGAGPILHEITNIPGDTDSGILLGELGGYTWPITLEGGLTAQRVIDSLFGQNAESALYLNIHTNSNANGEIWAFFNKVTGSIDPPPPPTQGDIGYPLALLSGNDLEREIWRFLDQATFGAKQAEVDSIKAAIEAQRTGGNPTYSRIEEFENWIDTQMAMEQTWLLDFTLAADFMEWKLRGFYDPTDYQPFVLNAGGANERTINTPVEPGTYPVISRSNPDPEQWVPTGPYPLGPDEILVGQAGVYNGLGDVDDQNRRRGLFTLMLNAGDQLRQKMGYALQQINVVSENDQAVFLYHLGAANYQDQLNYHAFGKYRDIIDWVVWSPQMGNYLSSYRNNRTVYDDNGTPLDPSDDIVLFAPDENLAREVMQLFTVGLFELYLDGSLRLSSENGLPKATYDNDHITELSRILTGHAYSVYNVDPNGTVDTSLEENDTWHTPIENNSFTRGGGNQYVSTSLLYRMKMFGANHDTGLDHFTGNVDPYDITGGKSIDNTGLGLNDQERGIKDVGDALDWLAGVIDGNSADDFTGDPENPASSHNSTPGFIATRLIQRFVTSNPTEHYVYHVAKAFKDGFDRDFDGVVDVPGGEGDLAAALKTVLLHPEARNLDNVLLDRFGKKLTALEVEMKLIRTLEAHTYTHIEDRTDPGFPTINGGTPNYPDAAELTSYNYPASQADNFEVDCWYRFPDTDLLTESNEASLTISPFKEETVFSFQLPDYAPSDIALVGLLAPEMQLVTELTSIQNINYFETMIRTYPDGHQLDNRIDRIGAFVSPFNSNNIDGVRIPYDLWLNLTSNGGRQLFPTSADAGSTSELIKDTEFVRRLDLMLMAGGLNARYVYNHGDDDANAPGDPGPNPLETIIDLVRLATSNASNSNPNINERAREKMMDALWSISQCADFNVRK